MKTNFTKLVVAIATLMVVFSTSAFAFGFGKAKSPLAGHSYVCEFEKREDGYGDFLGMVFSDKTVQMKEYFKATDIFDEKIVADWGECSYTVDTKKLTGTFESAGTQVGTFSYKEDGSQIQANLGGQLFTFKKVK